MYNTPLQQWRISVWLQNLQMTSLHTGLQPPRHSECIKSSRVHMNDASRKCDLEKDRPSRKRYYSVIAEPIMIPQCLPQNPIALDSNTSHLNPVSKNGSGSLERVGPARKKSISRVAEPSKWKQNKQKQLRMEGKAYISKRKKDGKTVTKQPRAIGPRCTSNACKKASNRLCNDISEEGRKKLFNDFWQRMNWAQRKVYVSGLVNCNPVERSRAAGAASRRSVSLHYHLRVDGKKKQVCKIMFLSTLGIGEWSVLNWVQKVTKKCELSENKLENIQAVPQPNQSHSPVTIQINQGEHATDKDKSTAAPELESPVRKKSRVAKPLTWKQNRQKQLRMEGKQYNSKRKKDGATVTKEPRTMGQRYMSNACKKASNRFCADISEEVRKGLFDEFWQGMNWMQRKVYVAGLVDRDPVERTRAPWTQSRRSVSLRYHLIVNSDRKQVCKKMFLSTLGIGEWSVLNWAQNATAHNTEPDGNKKKRIPRKSRKASEHSILKEFLESLPKVPSYYCGTSISKFYLEPMFSNMSEVYRHYNSHCVQRQTTPLSRQVFCAVFKKMDLGLCDPKKDQGCSFNMTGFNEIWEEYCMEREAPGS
ncbi:uncharacterized protein LOC130118550 [Lampris incognitus]|uniref:uncharacterized protein LOC130118550 n=1 Tax=Lampris incognitus TaxID=2546036 RepID=UPI0024B576FB|nr:uncharacterized protein LOC130118550 [Lampris incognitus]